MRGREQDGLLNLCCQPAWHSREPPEFGVSHARGCNKDSAEIPSGGRRVGEAGGPARNDASSPLGLLLNTAWLDVNERVSTETASTDLLREELALSLRINFKYSSWTFSIPHWHRSSLGQCKGMGGDTNVFSGRSSLPFTQWVLWQLSVLSALAYLLLSNRDSRAPTPYICSGTNKFLSKINTLSISFRLPILCLLFWS